MGGTYPYMDLNAKYEKRYYDVLLRIVRLIQIMIFPREIAICKQNVGQKEDFMHSNFQMDISLLWIDAAFTQHLKVYLNIFIFHPR